MGDKGCVPGKPPGPARDWTTMKKTTLTTLAPDALEEQKAQEEQEAMERQAAYPPGGCCGNSPASGAGLRGRLAEGHVLATLMDEHARILVQLDRLEYLARQLSLADERGVLEEAISVPDAHERGMLEEVIEVTERLVGAESHHQREEDVLFPELVRLGIEGPPRVMEMEHTDLRERERTLLATTAAALAGERPAAARVAVQAVGLVRFLREHIAKEDGVLYPTALAAIGEAAWDEIRRRCDAIGYCCGHHHGP